MNYEELLESRNGAAMKKEQLPFGSYYKKQVDNKYVNALDLRMALADDLLFCEDLSKECEQNAELVSKHQLRFKLAEDSSGLYGVTIEPGSFQTLERLLEDTPAIVATNGFAENVLGGLAEQAEQLHEKGIYHICYAPSNLFVRKGDNQVLTLLHGSAYQNMKRQEELYESCLDYIAPEVLEDGTMDERSDVYSLGKLMERLYEQSTLPLEYKNVVKKATQENPDARYHSVADMMSAIKNRRNVRKTLLMAIAALAVCLLGFGLYVSLVPQVEDIEYVAPVQEAAEDDLLDDGFDPMTELGLPPEDTTGVLTPAQQKRQKEYEAKAEAIFRKQYAARAEKILQKIYNRDYMSSSEKQFMAASTSTMEELSQLQVELASQTSLSDERSQRIASEIIEQISNRLKSNLSPGYGVQKGDKHDEE